MEKNEEKDRERIESVLRILKKQAPLTLKQEKFCSNACIMRFLRARGDNVKKAAKHLSAVLSWRDAIGTEHLIADEFSAELSEGVAFVSGTDQVGRPILIFRIKQDYPKLHSQKSYVRLLVFTLEVAISSLSRFVDQLVLIFDASFFRSGSAFLNVFMCTLKILSDYYPALLHKAFVVDPPSLFPYLWKGARPFVEQWASTVVVSSLDFKGAADEDTFASNNRTTSLRFDPSPKLTAAAAAGRSGSASSRFSFTVSHLDSLKPWYLSMTTTTRGAVAPASPSLAGVSPVNARSYSFASPGARSSAAPQRPAQQPRTPRPSFLQSPLIPFWKDGAGESGRSERGREAFLPYLRFYRRPYDEVVYRGKMKPPLGGLVSIVSPTVKLQRRHVAGYQQRI